ncbi:endonuclease/exonuclease/phosphatase family protein [Salirhabdus salicampi]|uniref:endonuclease/exonuclease/phosphatase family protein n=1 Tax=Salirhabdus salicampi TaxID=476102 RepID=UPI0020C2F54C|nr:endonuclease/exonuclease/phosphatase family protein [Salirhabdus salicampi]MCP8616047.1 endonuclease/exonuclease/phosphatase family protein [Salirhabdus salicampi]
MHKIHMLTFNIHHGKGQDKELNLERIATVIQSTNAQIVGLNEVDKHFSERSNFFDQAYRLANKLNMEFAFGPAITTSKKERDHKLQYGNAILSTYPIVGYENHPFDFLPRIVEDRALLEAAIQLENRTTLRVYVTHISFAPFLHKKQTEFVINKVRNRGGPAVIMGDWNMKPTTKSWDKVVKHFNDSWVIKNGNVAGGYTYPSHRPRMRLDYIFTTSDIDVMHTKVIKQDEDASDHLPYMATIQI